MAEQERPLSELLAGFSDNITEAITPENVRDLVMSAMLVLSPELHANLSCANTYKVVNVGSPAADDDGARLQEVTTVETNLEDHEVATEDVHLKALLMFN